ncbi:hypothetical protein NEF87_002497 [Candidatus Lokiarchaeum ossiferum]|uniref:SWIM-type domain-containing protein n=1 Tax=Candidatus Lokiarchaeum ossiferum TaxID=2951803 RepID=A0ABY6HTL6_9ARCH|nr:hypothetical protein NEF87_002497 [Candidatus Lokiarchaeum sp. B-35]
MAFTIPSDLKNIVLHWWKIIDQPEINVDELYNFIAFDLFLAPLEKTKKIVQQAIHLEYLSENKESESISLSDELQQEFLTWQEKGILKAKTMAAALAQSWRPPIDITPSMTYQALLSDLVDVSVLEKAGKIRSSAVSLDLVAFDDKIEGIVKSKDDGGISQSYRFKIDVKARSISHSCPEYNSLRKSQKQFCIHIARIFMKLFVKDSEKTIELLRNIVYQKSLWFFE